LTFKNLCDDSLGRGLSWVLPKFELFGFGSVTFFSNLRTSRLDFFELGLIPCILYTFPNVKDYRLCEYKVLQEVKIGVYLYVKLNN
jgi:hypothetical protein